MLRSLAPFPPTSPATGSDPHLSTLTSLPVLVPNVASSPWVFEVWCLHIPVKDRTPFEGLVKMVEETVRIQHASSLNKPIYLVGDSFGECLALAVAARNPTIDLVLVLANPATSFDRSQLKPLLPLFESLPNELHFTVPYLLSIVMGEPVKMAMVTVDTALPPGLVLEKLSNNLTALLPRLSGLSDIIPKDTLLWKLILLKSAAAYANSRLHAVTAEVLLLARGYPNFRLSQIRETQSLYKQTFHLTHQRTVMDFTSGKGKSIDEGSSNPGNRKKHYIRHSTEQVQRLDEFFKICSNPTEIQRQQLGEDLGLTPRQIKFWFVNKKIQTRIQNDRESNKALKEENEILLLENLALKEMLNRLRCPNCNPSDFDDSAS